MAAKKKAPTSPTAAQQKRAEEVKEIQVDVHHDNVTNVPTELVEPGTAAAPKADKAKEYSFQQVGNEVVLTIGKTEALRFDREGLAGFLRHVSRIQGTL